MVKNNILPIRVSDIQKERIEKFAKDNKMGVPEFVRYACEFFISRGSLFYPDSELAIQNTVNINPVMDLLTNIQKDLKTEIKQLKRSIKVSDLEREEIMEAKQKEIARHRLERLLQTEKFKEKYLQNWISEEELMSAIREESKPLSDYFDWEIENIPLEMYPDENVLQEVLFDLNAMGMVNYDLTKGVKAKKGKGVIKNA